MVAKKWVQKRELFCSDMGRRHRQCDGLFMSEVMAQISGGLNPAVGEVELWMIMIDMSEALHFSLCGHVAGSETIGMERLSIGMLIIVDSSRTNSQPEIKTSLYL